MPSERQVVANWVNLDEAGQRTSEQQDYQEAQTDQVWPFPLMEGDTKSEGCPKPLINTTY